VRHSFAGVAHVVGGVCNLVNRAGKRWIPFYFGNDARRMQVLYKGVGCLIFADGNAWGAGGGELIQIEHDASGACYQP